MSEKPKGEAAERRKERIEKRRSPKKEDIPKEEPKAPKEEAPKKEEKAEEKPKKEKEEKKVLKESIHTVGLRKAFGKPRKKTKKAAIAEIRHYLAKHTRKTPKISEDVNKAVWEKSKPPRKLKIKIVEEEEFATAELP